MSERQRSRSGSNSPGPAQPLTVSMRTAWLEVTLCPRGQSTGPLTRICARRSRPGRVVSGTITMNSKKWIVAWLIAVVIGALWIVLTPLAKERDSALAIARRIAKVEGASPLTVIQCDLPDGLPERLDSNTSRLSELHHSKMSAQEARATFECVQTNFANLRDRATSLFFPDARARKLLELRRYTVGSSARRYVWRFPNAEMLVFSYEPVENSVGAYFYFFDREERASVGYFTASLDAFNENPCLVGREVVTCILTGKEINAPASSGVEDGTHAPRKFRVIPGK